MYGNMVSVFFYLYALIKAPSTQLYYFFSNYLYGNSLNDYNITAR